MFIISDVNVLSASYIFKTLLENSHNFIIHILWVYINPFFQQKLFSSHLFLSTDKYFEEKAECIIFLDDNILHH